MPENAHTGQIQAVTMNTEQIPKIPTTGYSIPLDYVAIAVTFFALGFWAAVTATKASAGHHCNVRN